MRELVHCLFLAKYSSSLSEQVSERRRIVIIRSMRLLFLFLVLWPNRCSGGFRYSRHFCLILSFLLFLYVCFSSLRPFLVLPFRNKLAELQISMEERERREGVEGEGRGGTSTIVLPHKAAVAATIGQRRKGKGKGKKERKGCRAVLHKTVSVKAENESLQGPSLTY